MLSDLEKPVWLEPWEGLRWLLVVVEEGPVGEAAACGAWSVAETPRWVQLGPREEFQQRSTKLTPTVLKRHQAEKGLERAGWKFTQVRLGSLPGRWSP